MKINYTIFNEWYKWNNTNYTVTQVQLNLKTIFGIKDHPLPWLTEILNGVEHANFFETRATEYSKVATKGNWEGKKGVWDNFDKKVKSFQK